MQDIALSDSPLTAHDVARGIARLFWQRKSHCLTEMMLPGGRRADIMSFGEDGRITIVEIKVSVADLRGDAKWRDYLPWCDEFYWGIPAGFEASLLDEACFSPEMSGLIVADRFEAAVLRPPAQDSLAPARRKRATLLFARAAAARHMRNADPFLEGRG
ncbi:MmcB family DNA repair protein [Pacificimonas sp. WHA3]|uniref:MmcB family DNA repair protein n=1 Tax=Pacificimonas pallii TaxID=2827236 RepID=A0ABS6SBL4_9SPHN|nr:MmcB family DNA repair protein [Pacificimonas pallii]MBV7255745.1 MmcB family DNA repair protein [Pacificimonas pallii]